MDPFRAKMSDLSRRDIDDKIGIQRPGAAEAKRGQGSPVSDRGIGIQGLGAAEVKRGQQRSPASDGARAVVHPRSGPVVDESWPRGEAGENIYFDATDGFHPFFCLGILLGYGVEGN